MNSLALILSLISVVFCSSGASKNDYSYKAMRQAYAFSAAAKWDCFYRTSTPVPNLNPAVWRKDKHGNLMMAGLNFNIPGCLCYTFDHITPISDAVSVGVSFPLVRLMTSIDNCQALNYRVNALKGSNPDYKVKSLADSFGCDDQTMALFTPSVCRYIQKKLMTPDRLTEISGYYNRYVDGTNFVDPADVGGSKSEYFKYLNKLSDSINRKIDAQLQA